MQRTTCLSLLCEEPSNRFNLKRVADWRSCAMTFEVERFIRVQITRSLVRSSNGAFLAVRVRMCNATRTAISDEIESVDISGEDGGKE